MSKKAAMEEILWFDNWIVSAPMQTRIVQHFQRSCQHTCHLKRTGAATKAIALGSKCLAVARFAKHFLVDGEQEAGEAVKLAGDLLATLKGLVAQICAVKRLGFCVSF